MKQPALELPGHRLYYHYPSPASYVTLKCDCGWQVTRSYDAELVHDWHQHLDDVIRLQGRAP